MASVADIHTNFLDALNESRSLFAYCRSPFGPHSNAGIESAFLDSFKAWEVFLDELVFAYMRGEPDTSGNLVPSIVSLPTDDKDVYIRIINGGGRRRYIDWANPDNDVRPRLRLFFTPPLDVKLDSGLTELKEIATCRNAIAHSSGRASEQLSGLWRQKRGTSTSSLSRCADVLLLSYSSNPPVTLFERYLDVLEVLSQNLVQV